MKETVVKGVKENIEVSEMMHLKDLIVLIDQGQNVI
jgi:hypothetical protein